MLKNMIGGRRRDLAVLRFLKFIPTGGTAHFSLVLQGSFILGVLPFPRAENL
jgi:hypothetical protein